MPRDVPKSGSIPALAGEPPTGRDVPNQPWVYPRACGGTPCTIQTWTPSAGLSPRLRGNRGQDVSWARRYGSIPALAGEPQRSLCLAARMAVYPRACGGTHRSRLLTSARNGLSPRLRGNPQRSIIDSAVDGSIPALAGEPALSAGPPGPCPVYPRACGGTGLVGYQQLPDPGLSPRLRGNLGSHIGCGVGSGSIPALAGEPLAVTGGVWYVPVYPRACGGTNASAFQI